MTDQLPEALIVYQGFYPWEVRIEKFVNVLRSCGLHCTLLCRWNGEASEQEEHDGLRIVRLGFGRPAWQSLPFSYNPLWRRAIRMWVRRLKPKLIVAREMLITEACTSAAKGEIPVLMDMAEHYPAAMRSWKKYRANPLLRFLVHTLRLPDKVEAQAVRRCTAIVCVCYENAERVARTYSLPPERFHLVLNTPPRDAFAHLQTDTTRPVRCFSYQGYLTRERGVERCIDAFDSVAKDLPDIRLEVYGDGESMPEIQYRRASSKFADRIHLHGSFNHSELPSIMEQSDVGLVVFDQDEFRQHTIPNKLFDYLLCAKPVIVSNCSPMAELVHQNHCGIVIDTNSPDQLAQALLRMVHEDVHEMAENARVAAITRYHWEYDAQTLRQLVLSLL